MDNSKSQISQNLPDHGLIELAFLGHSNVSASVSQNNRYVFRPRRLPDAWSFKYLRHRPHTVCGGILLSGANEASNKLSTMAMFFSNVN